MNAKQFTPATYILALENSIQTARQKITEYTLFKGGIIDNWSLIIEWRKRELRAIKRILNTDWGREFSQTALFNKIMNKTLNRYNYLKSLGWDEVEKLNKLTIYKPDMEWLEQVENTNTGSN